MFIFLSFVLIFQLQYTLSYLTAGKAGAKYTATERSSSNSVLKKEGISGKISLMKSAKASKPKELEDGFVSWFEGWVHYHKYNNDSTISRPTNFFVNSDYRSQRRSVNKVLDEDNNGLLIIPDKNAYYLVLGSDTLTLYSTREDPYVHQVDHLSYKFIEPIPEDKKYEGGVRDMFSFSIGHCIMIRAHMQLENSMEGSPQRWIFCLDNKQKKQSLLNSLIKAKLHAQSQTGEIVSSESLMAEKAENDVANYLRNTRRQAKSDEQRKKAKATDGYWITMQDWTECNMKCGGGQMFKHRMCVPPKNGGRSCQGEEVETKECNTQPCPSAHTYVREMEARKPIIKNPIVKIGSFSRRPQRYSMCVIKDVDGFMNDIDKDTNTEMKIPVRVVMNNRTISLYKSDDYQDVAATFNLSESQLTVTENTYCCFSIADKLKSKNICGYDKNCGTPESNEWVNQWKEDFRLFKTQCSTGVIESLLDKDDEKLLDNKAKKKMQQANLEISKAKQIRVKQEMQKEQINDLRSNIVKTQETGFEAIEKELDIENMLKEEEKQKEADDLSLLQDKVRAEADQLKCVKESIAEKEIDNDFVAQQHEAEKDVKDIKKEFSQRITKKRETLRNLLEKMRRRSRMERAKLEGEIKTLRNKISQDLLIAQKNGSIDSCREGKIDIDKRNAYCNKNFVDDFVNNNECRREEEFCYLCCETEFGNSFMDNREKCYSMCDNKEKAVEKEAVGDRWTWKPNN